MCTFTATAAREGFTVQQLTEFLSTQGATEGATQESTVLQSSPAVTDNKSEEEKHEHVTEGTFQSQQFGNVQACKRTHVHISYCCRKS